MWRVLILSIVDGFWSKTSAVIRQVKIRARHSIECLTHAGHSIDFSRFVTLWPWPLNIWPTINWWERSWWTISVTLCQSLVVILVSAVFVYRAYRQNHTQTQTFAILLLAWVKPGFHYPSWRPELTARVDGWPVNITRQHGPCWRVMETGHPSTRAVNSGPQLG